MSEIASLKYPISHWVSMTLKPDVDSKIKELRKDLDTMVVDDLIDSFILFLEGDDDNKTYFKCSLLSYKNIIRVKKAYKLGLKFRENQRKEVGWIKKTFYNKDKVECEELLDWIKLVKSEATYYRYLKIFRERFDD